MTNENKVTAAYQHADAVARKLLIRTYKERAAMEAWAARLMAERNRVIDQNEEAAIVLYAALYMRDSDDLHGCIQNALSRLGYDHEEEGSLMTAVQATRGELLGCAAMIEHTPEIDKLAAALAAAQGELRNVPRDETNPHFKHRYASLEAVTETVRPVLSRARLAFTQAPGGFHDNTIEITTMLLAQGRAVDPVDALHADRQARCAGRRQAITYGLSYSLMAVLGVAPTDDDDAESAGEAPMREATVQDALTDDALPVHERLIAELERRPTAEAVVRLFDAPKFRAKYNELIATRTRACRCGRTPNPQRQASAGLQTQQG